MISSSVLSKSNRVSASKSPEHE